MPGFVGIPELLVLGLVVLLVFGPKRLPEMGRSLGRGLREFKSSVVDSRSEENGEESERAASLALVDVNPAQAPRPVTSLAEGGAERAA